MKKIIQLPLFIIAIGSLTVFFAGCNGDENEEDPANDLLGLWTVSDIEFEARVGNQSFVDYLVNVGGYSEAEALLWYTFLEALLEEEFDFTGTIELFENYTYITKYDDETDDGTWSLSADGNTLTFDDGTMYEMEFTIVSLTSNKLVVSMTETSMEDLDDDPSTPDAEITVEVIMELTK